MEDRKLTKADIDKVRQIEGFPVAKDEDIIALSRPPYYTACPNPFIEEFIRENGTPYDEATDDYHREPFAADVSEGKNDPIYNAHSYHTKVPHKAIMRYILHYTKPGDIVFDGFCGTGMTGVAAQMCGCPDTLFKAQIEAEMPDVEWGPRKAILNDLSPVATFISQGYNTSESIESFEEEARRILAQLRADFGWMMKTYHIQNGEPVRSITGEPIECEINCVLWSEVFICPSCARELVYYDVALDRNAGKVLDEFRCECGCQMTKRDCVPAVITQYDKVLQKPTKRIKYIPVMICYEFGKKRYEKRPDQHDLEVLRRINELDILDAIPNEPMMGVGEKWGDTWRSGHHLGITHIHHFYTERNLYLLSRLRTYAILTNSVLCRFALSGIINRSTQMNRIHISNYFHGGGGWNAGYLKGTLYISSLPIEASVFEQFEDRIQTIARAFRSKQFVKGNVCIQTGSQSDIRTIPDNSIDYVFTDPPFGANIVYSELSFIWEAWLSVKTNNKDEAIIHVSKNKGLPEYQQIMEKAFCEYYRVLKPNHWITIEFHNSQNSVWTAIQEGLMRAGFIVADVRTINKQQSSFNQLFANSAVKQDLVISAYKPKESFVQEFQLRAGDPEMAWVFVRQHLRNVPVVADGNHDGKLDIIAERQDFLLFDRMVAWHIMNGIPVPMDSHTFYEGLRQRFLLRDGMFFLPDQVNEYDDKRSYMDLDSMQMELVPMDEKSSISWLNLKLSEHPMTYQEIQPLFMQELHQSRQEKMPELLDMLKENFIQDDKGAWYVPNLSDAADLAKVRRRALLKEFWDSCATGKGRLKVFRMEAIRAGFDECWKIRDYRTIVSVGERLPETVLQEDQALLMYYDNACSRV